MAKRLLSLKPAVRTGRSYKRVGLRKQQKSFQGLAMYGHEVLMPLYTVHINLMNVKCSMSNTWKHWETITAAGLEILALLPVRANLTPFFCKAAY
jgi:hypothetical protein